MLWIQNNTILTDLSPLKNIVSLGTDLSVEENDALISLTGLNNIAPASISNLSIYNNPLLSDCDVLSICEYLLNPGGTIEIYNNSPGCNNQEEIEDGCDCSCLTDGAYFHTQTEIDNFQVNYPNCTEIDGELVIGGDDISGLNGLNALSTVHGGVYISDWLSTNPLLTSFSGLENITYIGGVLWISGNEAVSDFNGFNNLNYTGGGLVIADNITMTSLSGLDGLNSIGGPFAVTLNPVLINLTGLENLSSIGGEIIIEDNDVLHSLTGIDNINPGTISELYIVGNPSLSTCNIQSICDYIASPGATVEIQNNATGCDNPDEVEEACENVSIEENITGHTFNIFPNPSYDIINIRNTSPKIGKMIISITDISGIKIKTHTMDCNGSGNCQLEIDLSDLPTGMYFITLISNDPSSSRQTEKIVKF